MSDKQTKFEQDLEAFFPEIYKLHTYSKFDKHFWSMWDAMLQMYDGSKTGQVTISFTIGKVDRVEQKTDFLSYKKNLPNRNVPGMLDD